MGRTLDGMYDNLILDRIKDAFDRLLPVFSIIAFIGAGLGTLDKRAYLFPYINTGLSLLLIVMYAFRHRINSTCKILLFASSICIIGICVILYGGFSGGGLVPFMVSCFIITSFLPIKTGRIFGLGSIALLLLLSFGQWLFMRQAHKPNAILLADPFNWLFHMLLYVTFVSVILVVVYAIKKTLTESLADAQDHLGQISRLAYYDPLTGLPNRNRFLGDLEACNGATGCVVLLKVKDLSLVNSVHGTDAGDRVLRLVAGILEKSAGSGDLVARSSGNEFAWYGKAEGALLPPIVEDVLANASAARDACAVPFHIQFQVGIATHPRGEPATMAMKQASIALEQAKRQRHDSIARYDAWMEDAFRRDDTIRKNIGEAIANREFTISYQLKYDVGQKKAVGAEALARWHSPELGQVSPALFIPLIENSSHMERFNRLIVTLVMEEYGRLRRLHGWDIPVSMNVSPAMMCSASFLGHLKEEAVRCGVPFTSIMIEITEESLIERIEEVIDVIGMIHALGARVSLDDFGTGYSSLSYLSRLDVDEVKMDRSFIQRLGMDEKTAVLIKAVVALKDAFGFDIVAEGVETQEQCDMVTMLGCRCMQGYLFSRPEPL